MSWTSFAMDRNIRRRANERYRSCEMDALRSTIWAMTNVIRGGKIVATTTNPSTTTTTTTFVYVSDDGMTRGGTMDRLLTPGDACSLLLGPPGTITPSVAFAPPPPPTTTTTLPTGVPKMTSWDDVAAETCWLLSYLTRDPSVVEYLCPPNDDHCDVLSALVARLSYATDAACRRLGVAVATAARGGNDIVNVNDDEVRAIGCLVPICRALRNVAYADDDGRYGNSILSAGWGGVTIAETTGSSLAKLVVLGTLGAGSDANAIAAEAASTAGACLCRALLPPSHHAARAGLERLLPALRDAFVGELSTFELRREVAWAIWSAVSSPPPPEDTCDDVPFVSRTEFLVGIVHPSPRDVANALTTMLSTLDSDAMEVSLLLIDALLRRLGGDGVVGIGGWFGSGDMTTLFEEVGLVDALWRVCDADSEEGTIAEMAAAILDDFYERDDVLDDEYYADASLRPSSSGGQYRFQIPPGNGIPSGGFDFGGATVDHNHPIPRGDQLPPSGRGRGRVLPSWMSLNDS
ncbi:hypothetical protein ACHAXA_006964 [Cyclostephanos tholiformis]|uniref:Uncharacterized protein n=1 Tax=Cyclostephanos tholiformis TaxID=382380 RepID=A0ABD3RXG1_9STRA